MSKKISIIGATGFARSTCLKDPYKEDYLIVGEDDLSVFDGYHTFEELYDHRIALFIALCRTFWEWHEAEGLSIIPCVWRSKVNGDGTTWDGWFIMGIGKEAGKQITYHLPLERWNETDFADTLDKAPDWDGHTPQDVLDRLKSL